MKVKKNHISQLKFIKLVINKNNLTSYDKPFFLNRLDTQATLSFQVQVNSLPAKRISSNIAP